MRAKKKQASTKNKSIAQSITAACKKAANASPKKRKQTFTEEDPVPAAGPQTQLKKQKKQAKLVPAAKPKQVSPSPEALFEKFFDELHDQPGATDKGYTFITSTAKDKNMKRLVTVTTSLVKML